MSIATSFEFLRPWIFSPTVLVGTAGALVFYVRGLRRGRPVGFARSLAFVVGIALVYVSMQTRFDYYAQYMFFMHRLQHLILHHLGPFLIALAAPGEVLWRGMPEVLKRWVAEPLWRQPVIRGIYRFVQHPVVAPVLFVGLIFFWLTPSIHFRAMLDLRLYHLMNMSMLIDGLLFWWLILDPRSPARGGTLGFGKRMLLLVLIMPPQILLGAYIALDPAILYDVYSVCGRAWPIAPIVDQQLGGLITWIPGAMMSALAGLVVLRYLLHDSAESAPALLPEPLPR